MAKWKGVRPFDVVIFHQMHYFKVWPFRMCGQEPSHNEETGFDPLKCQGPNEFNLFLLKKSTIQVIRV